MNQALALIQKAALELHVGVARECCERGIHRLVLTVEPLNDEQVPAPVPAEGGTTG